MTFDQPWVKDALCAQVDVGDIFFPESTGINQDARRICMACEVRQQCLDYAVRRPEWGIWGGTSMVERKRLRKQLGIKLESGWGIPHGTEAGARAHYRRGEKPCPDCLQAANRRARERDAG